MSEKQMPSLRPIGRRQFAKMCAGSLALATDGCRRSDDPAYALGSTLVMAVSDISAVLPDDTDFDWVPFMPLATTAENGDYIP